MAWFPKKKILVPVDFSDQSLSALDTALEMVENPADVLVVHVLPEISDSEIAHMMPSIDKQARVRHAEQALRERLADAKYQDVRLEIQFGDPGHKITEVSQREHAELIVLPSHGRTGLTRLLIGSVAERVVRLAHCPLHRRSPWPQRLTAGRSHAAEAAAACGNPRQLGQTSLG